MAEEEMAYADIGSLVGANEQLVTDGMDFLGFVKGGPDGLYTRIWERGDLKPFDPIAHHMDHILSIYGTVFDELKTGAVCFHRRERSPDVRTRIAAGFERSREVLAALRMYRDEDPSRIVRVEGKLAYEGRVLVTSGEVPLGFVLDRVADHTIHHHSSMNKISSHFDHHYPVDSFGMSPSTPGVYDGNSR